MDGNYRGKGNECQGVWGRILKFVRKVLQNVKTTNLIRQIYYIRLTIYKGVHLEFNLTLIYDLQSIIPYYI